MAAARQLQPPPLAGLGAALALLCLSAGVEAAPEFSGYLRKVLKNHTIHTCDGEQLIIMCPHKTTVSILGAFYGRRVPSPHLCPSPGNASEESTECMSATARQKLLDECQDQRWCQFSVHSQVFGPDPCPGTHKYLVASYKCRPANHRIKTVCENDKLRLQCRPKSILAIYSASYGRFLRGKPECDALNTEGPHIECLAPDALRRVSKKCHRKENCTVTADRATFGDPCFPGMKKQLRVSYTCVPRQLLEEVGPDTSDPFLLSDYTHGNDQEPLHVQATRQAVLHCTPARMNDPRQPHGLSTPVGSGALLQARAPLASVGAALFPWRLIQSSHLSPCSGGALSPTLLPRPCQQGVTHTRIVPSPSRESGKPT